MSQSLRDNQDRQETTQQSYPDRVELLRIALGRLFIGRTIVWKAVCDFAYQFEYKIIPACEEMRASKVTLELNPDMPQVSNVKLDRKKSKFLLDNKQALWTFLREIGIQRVELESRMEHNQIADIFGLLIVNRKSICKYRKSGKADRITRLLFSKKGLHYACAETTIYKETLTIRYSYCTLQYSHLVRRFEQRHKGLRDHRALFRAAPRYGLLFGLIVLSPTLLYALMGGRWYLFGLALLAAVTLYALVYLLLMMIGSIEYDNEEKTYRLERANEQLEKYTTRVREDIRKARLIQQRLLPDLEKLPHQDQLQWAGRFVPAAEVGGDYFDVQPLDVDRLALVFCDVSGHGMAGAFVTAVIKATFQGYLGRGGPLEELAQELNRNLYRMTPDDSFAAAFLGIYDVPSQTLLYCNAGHSPEPWKVPAASQNGRLEALNQARNLLLGIDENMVYHTATCTFMSGDKLVIVSDGIIESVDDDGQCFGDKVLEKILIAEKKLSIDAFAERVFEEVRNFCGFCEQLDDQTLLAVEIK